MKWLGTPRESCNRSLKAVNIFLGGIQLVFQKEMDISSVHIHKSRLGWNQLNMCTFAFIKIVYREGKIVSCPLVYLIAIIPLLVWNLKFLYVDLYVFKDATLHPTVANSMLGKTRIVRPQPNSNKYKWWGGRSMPPASFWVSFPLTFWPPQQDPS